MPESTPVSSDDRPTPPSVGIFWFVPDGEVSTLISDRTPLTEAEPYGDMLTHDRGHAEFWDHLIVLGSAHLRAAGMPMTPLHAEYDEYPRGRVVYDRRQDMFIAYADRRIQASRFRQAVEHAFAIGTRQVMWGLDGHYARTKRIPPLRQ